MPTRVVDVGREGDKEPRLVLTADLPVAAPLSTATARRYLALSHCWGLNMPSTATTTSFTIDERLKAIPLAGLSRTFADFISIARRTHIRYVWIDSLCIIQDSKEDWEKEAAQMASVYSNAHCTVAASSSADGNGGCHLDPDSAPYGPVTLSIHQIDTETGQKTLQRVRVFSLSNTATITVLQQDPLNSRGWTFQERELSNRVLHFSKDSIRWECRSLKASLEFPWQDTNAFNGHLRIFDVGKIGPQPIQQRLNQDRPPKENYQETWFEAVYQYTGRALTKQSDVLPAFSGIARSVQSHTGDRYLAGLWSSSLIHDLCWNSAWHPSGNSPIFDPNNPKPINHVRSSEYIAPSWSWAAIKGQVRYETWIFNALDPESSLNATRFMPRILEATTVPAGPDEYSQLRGGAIRLVGKMKPALTRGEGFRRQDREGVYDFHAGQMREVGMIKYDVPTDAPVGEMKPIFCLCMLPRADRYGDSVGLALVLTGGRVFEFRRVGLVSAIQLSWYEIAPECQITIV
jgi:Heterokaryon incompatibility protein (HET)